MEILNVAVEDKIATHLSRGRDLVCGNSGYVIEFLFDSEWSEYETKTARFVWNGKYQDVEFTGNTCSVPIVRNTKALRVGVFAGNLQTTTSALINCRHSVLCGDETPTEGNEQYYASKAEEAADRAEEAVGRAENAVDILNSIDVDKIANSVEDAETAATNAEESANRAEVAAGILGNFQVLQGLGDSQSDVMSQSAVTKEITPIKKACISSTNVFNPQEYSLEIWDNTDCLVSNRIPCTLGDVIYVRLFLGDGWTVVPFGVHVYGEDGSIDRVSGFGNTDNSTIIATEAVQNPTGVKILIPTREQVTSPTNIMISVNREPVEFDTYSIAEYIQYSDKIKSELQVELATKVSSQDLSHLSEQLSTVSGDLQEQIDNLETVVVKDIERLSINKFNPNTVHSDQGIFDGWDATYNVSEKIPCAEGDKIRVYHRNKVTPNLAFDFSNKENDKTLLSMLRDGSANQAAITRTSEGMRLIATGSDPYFVLNHNSSDALPVTGQQAAYIVVKYRTTAVGVNESVQLRFYTNVAGTAIGWGHNQSTAVADLNNDGEWHYIIVDTTYHNGEGSFGTFPNNLQAFRVDIPDNASIGDCVDIACIYMFSSEQDAWRYINAQSVSDVVARSFVVSNPKTQWGKVGTDLIPMPVKYQFSNDFGDVSFVYESDSNDFVIPSDLLEDAPITAFSVWFGPRWNNSLGELMVTVNYEPMSFESWFEPSIEENVDVVAENQRNLQKQIDDLSGWIRAILVGG